MQSHKKIFLAFWATTLVLAFSFYLTPFQNQKKIKRSFASESEAKIIVDNETVLLGDFFEKEIFSDGKDSLDSVTREFLKLINSNDKVGAWSDANVRYLKLAMRLKKVSYGISTASIQYSNYSEQEKKDLLKAVESYFSAYYVLAWHHAYLFHLKALPTESKLDTCLDFSKKGTWAMLNNCRLPVEKEFALVANKKLGADLASVGITSGATSYLPLVSYIQKNMVQINRYVALARIDLTHEVRNFLEFTVLKNWKDPYYYGKFLKFNGLREAISNYWSIARYQENPENLLRIKKDSDFLITYTQSEQNDWIGTNAFLRELFSKDFYFNGLNSYNLIPTKNMQEVSVYSPVWSELIQKNGEFKNLLWNDARFCKSSLGCKLPEATDLYLFIVKTIFGTSQSCETKTKNGNWSCISRLHNIFYGKAEFSNYEAQSEEGLSTQVLTDAVRDQMQSAVKQFITKNPGIINNAILPGEDLTNELIKLRSSTYQKLEIGKKIISPLIQAKTILIAGTIFDALGLENIVWNDEKNPTVNQTLKKDEKEAIYKNVYCRTAAILWGVNPKELNSELIECKQQTYPSDNFAKTEDKVNQLIYSKFNQKQFAKNNSVEKSHELTYFNDQVDATNVAQYLANPSAANKYQFRPFDYTTLKLYAKLKVGALGNENKFLYTEQEHLDYLEKSGLFDLSLMIINQKFDEVCSRYYPIKTKDGTECNYLGFKSIDTKVSILRKAVYETIYEAFAKQKYANDKAKQDLTIKAIKTEPVLPVDIKEMVVQKVGEYDQWSLEQKMQPCDKKENPKTTLENFKSLFKSGHGEQFIKDNSAKSLSLNSLTARSAQLENLWDFNAEEIRSLAGSWNRREDATCDQPAEFMNKGYYLVALGKALGLFDSEVLGAFQLNAEEKKLLNLKKIRLPYSRVTAYTNEPFLKDYNQFYAQYIYGLMSRKFAFLQTMRTNPTGNFEIKKTWYGTSFLDLAQLKSVTNTDAKVAKEFNDATSIKLVNKFLTQSWKDFKTTYGKDLINFYDSVNLGNTSSKLELGQDFKKIFDHYENFRFEFTSIHAIEDKIAGNTENARKYLESSSTLQKWFNESADKKIQNRYYPMEAFWEKISPYIMPVLLVASLLSIYGAVIGGVELMGAGLLGTMLTLDALSLTLFATQSLYNIVYKNNIDLPNTILAQSKVASSYSFYSPNDLPTSGKWLVNVSQSAASLEKENKDNENILSNQIWSYGIKAQSFKDVIDSKASLRAKNRGDYIGLFFDTVLFYIPSAPQIRRNFLILKNGRTLKSVMRSAGLPYMNLPQRIEYFFAKRPKVEIGKLSFLKKVKLAFDPKSQMLAIDKLGFQKIEENFLMMFMNKNQASRKTIGRLFEEASRKSLNPKIDLMHQELELYINFMKSFLTNLGKLKPEQWKELTLILNKTEKVQQVSLIKNRMDSWLKSGAKLDAAMQEEAAYLQKLFGNMPVKDGSSMADVFKSMSNVTEIHAKGGDFLTISLAESVSPELVKSVKEAHAGFIDVRSVINFYDEILNMSKYEWYNTSTKYMQNRLNNTLKLEENIFDSIKNSRLPITAEAAATPGKTFVEQLSMTEKLKMEDELAKAWTMSIAESSVEGTGLGLMMMLRDYQAMYTNLQKSPELLNFIKKNMGDDVFVQNFFNYALSSERAPLYPQIIGEHVINASTLQRVGDHLEKVHNGGAFYHYIEVDFDGLLLPAGKVP